MLDARTQQNTDGLHAGNAVLWHVARRNVSKVVLSANDQYCMLR